MRPLTKLWTARTAGAATRVVLALACLGAVACGPDFEPATRVTHMRVLGAGASVDAEPTRASARPGEDITVAWTLAFPAEEQPVSWAFITCVPEPTNFGVPICASPVGMPALQLEPAFAAPTLRLSVPDEATLGGATSLLVLGSICADGPVNLDDSVQRACADADGDGMLVTLELPLERDGQANAIPELDTVTLDSSVLTYEAPADAPATGCAGTDAPQIAWRDDVVALNLAPVGGSRESFTELRGAPPEPTESVEELQVESLTTAGEIDQRFAFFDDRNATIDLEWTLPLQEELDPSGDLVRFYFTVRDGRGGFSAQRRAVCLVGP